MNGHTDLVADLRKAADREWRTPVSESVALMRRAADVIEELEQPRRPAGAGST